MTINQPIYKFSTRGTPLEVLKMKTAPCGAQWVVYAAVSPYPLIAQTCVGVANKQ